MTGPAELLYGYAVLPSGPATGAQILPAATGDGPLVEAVAGARVNLAVSRVPEQEFGQGHIEARMGDEEWLSRLALSHFDVVARLFQQGPVLPLRLCTVFRSAESAAATLDANGAVLESALGKLTGTAQWSVCVTAGKPSRRAVKADSGAGYLRGLAQAQRELGSTRVADEQRATELARRLAGLAVAVEDAAGAEPGVLHAAAYLVRDEDARMFLDAAKGFGSEDATRGVTVDVRGPWPPYSFVPPLPEPS